MTEFEYKIEYWVNKLAEEQDELMIVCMRLEEREPLTNEERYQILRHVRDTRSFISNLERDCAEYKTTKTKKSRKLFWRK